MRIRSLSSLLLVAFVLFGQTVIASAADPQHENSLNRQLSIQGATKIGSDTCTACHADTSKNFQHAFHKQQGVDCEDCHGNGSIHVDAGGDVTKILSFAKRPAESANAACLSCHSRDEKVRHWSAGSHAGNHVRCIDCHQIHDRALKAAIDNRISFTTSTRDSVVAESVSPETSAVLRPRSATNDGCVKCHATQRAQLSMPYHHPLREGKMSCVDCHDPHGGPAGNNLRTANTNQLCLGCHAQYRGPFAYQHPPVAENCMNCHTAHGSANTNLLSVSEPALCLQCHSGHHNGAGLPLPDRCTNCHGSIHGTDVATPSGGSRFVDKGPYGVPAQPGVGRSPVAVARSQAMSPVSSVARLLPSHSRSYMPGAAGGALGLIGSGLLQPSSSGDLPEGAPGSSGSELGGAVSGYAFTPGTYRFVDGSGFLGRVGEYDSLQQSAGADAVTAYVSPQSHLTVVSRANVIAGDDYSAASQLTAGRRLQAGFDMRSFVQQQDNYPFYAGAMSPDLLPITDFIPSHTPFAVTRRIGNGYVRFKAPKLPVHLYVKGDWQARSGTTQLRYLDENTTPNCGESCHYTSQFQRLNYTTRNITGGGDVDLGPVRLSVQHHVSTFADRLTFPTASYSGPFTPGDEPPPAPIPVPPDVTAGNYFLNIPAPSQTSSDSLSLTWTPPHNLTFNANVSYARLRDTLTRNPQNRFDSDETLTWRPVARLRVTSDYHQHNLINSFTPYYDLYGNVSFHDHSAGARLDVELPKGFNVETYYRRGWITRSNAFLWPQAYSFNNTDLLTVVPSSFSNTTGVALRYHDRGNWSARAGYEWTGTHDPGYLTVPRSNNRAFANLSLTPIQWLVVANETSLLFQNDFSAVALPNIPDVFRRRNRFYANTATATLRFVQGWNLGLGYSYQQNNLNTYMAFQNDAAVAYVVDQPFVLYKQVTQAYWAESTFIAKQRLGLTFRVTYNSSRSGMRPDLNPNNAAQLGNAELISQGVFDPNMFQQALGNLQLGATQVSQMAVPQWIGQSKVYYRFGHRFEGGLLFYYGSYRDQFNPDLNGTLRTFSVYVGRSW